MSSELRSETARRNGAKSHGPVTPEGKARSAANSRRHGLTASVLLAGESDEDLQLLLADFMNQFQPQSGVEADLVEGLAIARWRLRRLLAIETNLFELEMVRSRREIDAGFKEIGHDGRLAFVFQQMSDHGKSLALLIRYEGSLNRSYEKALKHLRELQSSRQNRPPKEALGSFGLSEPPRSACAAAAPAQVDPRPPEPESDNPSAAHSPDIGVPRDSFNLLAQHADASAKVLQFAAVIQTPNGPQELHMRQQNARVFHHKCEEIKFFG